MSQRKRADPKVSARKPAPSSLPQPSVVTEIDKPAPFANDPIRGPPLVLRPEDSTIGDLNGSKYLSTALIDYVLQHVMPSNLPDDVLIGSSNSLSYFQLMNSKPDFPQQQDPDSSNVLRRKFQFYSLRRYRFFSVNCTRGHFFVVSVDFDMNSATPFDNVWVYDSLRKSSRQNRDAPKKDSDPAALLRHMQLFLAKFCAFATKHHRRLLDEPDLLLDLANYGVCPQQQNMYDCGLFATASLLHLFDEYQDLEHAFTAQQIKDLRTALYQRLSAKEPVDWNFMCSFLPNLNPRPSKLGEITPPQHNTATLSTEDGLDDDFYELFDTQTSDPATLEVEVPDKIFTNLFVTTDNGFSHLSDLDVAIDEYEKESGNRLVIFKSTANSRIYKCRSHVNCSFRAKFGLKRFTETIILKRTYTKATHSGDKAPTRAKDGRALKRRMKSWVESSVDDVIVVKDAEPVAKDVMKASANLKGRRTTYNQGYRAIADITSKRWEEDKSSFELVIPYLEKFAQLNPDSTTKYETDGNGSLNIKRVFVCPGIMKTTLRYVRPVMSLDAAHMKSKWGGTMYVASVKTACKEIYPVAVAIMRENENEEGWTWFLEGLHSAIEILVMNHPRTRVRYKYFTFISDRQKGLLPALGKVFPNNHGLFCSVHIARNTEKFGGKRVNGLVCALATTFSHRLSGVILNKIQRISVRARNYVEEIPSKHWRSTAWNDDPSLPPRYGIVTSNMSESANNMFEKAREGSWLNSLDTMLVIMMQRITKMRRKVKWKDGIVEPLFGELKLWWEKSAGYEVVEGEDNSNKFTIIRRTRLASETSKRYTIDIGNKTCECGQWQDNGYPCIDAMTYFQVHQGETMANVFREHVDELYTYETEIEMLKANIVPVCMETIAHDGFTLPPLSTSKRATGRPKKKRLRKRSRYAYDPEQSRIVCSRCKLKGHNVRTCLAREQNGQGDNDGGNALDLS